MPNRASRQKISTTIAAENAAFLRSMMKRGKAESLAEAVDAVIALARRAEARARLEAATEAYYASLSAKDLEEENELGEALAHEAAKVNFDE
jgi:hypothetical protein